MGVFEAVLSFLQLGAKFRIWNHFWALAPEYGNGVRTWQPLCSTYSWLIDSIVPAAWGTVHVEGNAMWGHLWLDPSTASRADFAAKLR